MQAPQFAVRGGRLLFIKRRSLHCSVVKKLPEVLNRPAVSNIPVLMIGHVLGGAGSANRLIDMGPEGREDFQISRS